MIKIISCFWNAEQYIEKCIDSIMSQTHHDYKVFLIDDLSNDNTVNLINNKIKNDGRFELISNEQKKGKLKNIDDILMNYELFDDEDIIVELDGDDWFFNEKVLERINEIYNSNKKLWLTNGSFIYSDGKFGFSSKVNPQTIRKDVFTFSHLRTWKCHLWRKIEEESFLDENGDYFMSAPDVAYSIPMIEIAGLNHYEFIPEIFYVYNAESPYNEHKPNSSSGGLFSQQKNANYIRNKKPYKSFK
jgi:glycosyltransferase involved in cell wall biosynthesis